MSFTVGPTDLGTPESAWSTCAPLRALPTMDWGEVRRIVAVAPHPDDEVLGIGGSLRRLHRSGAEVVVVAVTDGEGSHPGSTALPHAVLSERRRAETTAGLTRLGLADVEVVRLGVPDGGVAAVVERLSGRLDELLAGADVCLATWRGDGHPDHEAAGEAAARACRRHPARLVEYPVWAWHWADPDGDGLPWGRAASVQLAGDDVAAKAAAIGEHRTQIEPLGPDPLDGPVLPPAVLDRFFRPFEVVFR